MYVTVSKKSSIDTVTHRGITSIILETTSAGQQNYVLSNGVNTVRYPASEYLIMVIA